MTLFLSIILTIWGVMHLYVFWRLASVPWLAVQISRPMLIAAAIALWASYPVARILYSWKLDAAARPLEIAGATWIGILFLLFAVLLVADVVTLGGYLVPNLLTRIPGWALVAAGLLSIVALVQGIRPPVLRDYEVWLAGLPPERDGLVLVEISDLHLGTLINKGWLTRLVRRVNDLRPDLVAVVGDVVDGNVERVEAMRPVLAQLRAPLGVWAVTGNHEYYAGEEQCVRLFQDAGFTVLRDAWAEAASGLVLAGVDDLTAGRQFGSNRHSIESALATRPPGAVILLSHSPLQAELAARLGAGLMLSGHTHNGQLWPFSYLVRLRYPLLGGRHEVAGMPVIVCRGTGTWGPRMRLWRPSEIVRIKLRAAAERPR
ncbi:MAG TPA: metallophosphoesterase [Candidatus Paceibacterota bacterium]|nr:metallophosphoesterase [Verrucomicrobiota bacterium]HSA11118.1 metallophosphoesterase [Candidatus Paceibacterota bacterium]